MEQNRQFEIVPAMLVALAWGALGLTVVAVIGSGEVAEPVATAPPSRTHAPLRWPLAELPPLETPDLQLADEPSFLEGWAPQPLAIGLAVAPSTERDATDALVTAPLTSKRLARNAPPTATRGPVAYQGRLVVMTPAEPRWRAGDRARLVVTSRMRAQWAIARIDSVELARAAGRMISEPDYRTPAEWAVARLQQASRWRADAAGKTAATEPSRPAPARSILLLAPPKTVARKPVVRDRRPVTTPIVVPTILEYLSNAPSVDFPTPRALAVQLDRVAADRDLAPWAWATAYRLRTLGATPAGDELAVGSNFTALVNAVGDARIRAEQLRDGASATELRRAAYAIDRRVATWRPSREHAVTLAKRGVLPADQLANTRWASRGEALPRLTDTAVAAPLRVAARLEAYEARPSYRLAKLVATDAVRLAQSNEAEAVELSRAIETNYRNANVRVAIAAGLIERLLPAPEPTTSPVRDRIAGTLVTGRSTTQSQLDVELIPDEAAWRIGFAAEGNVVARTASHGRPARVVSHGVTRFSATKLVVVSRESLDAMPSVVEAMSASPRLVGLSTNYDRVPVLRDYARSTARKEYSRLRGRARVETQAKVEHRVRRELDDRVAEQIARLDARYEEAVLSRAERLGLRVEPLEMRTTDTRLISRLRLAGDQQLAAHTPRMRAPSDSLLSVQLHESTLNNALEGLELAGARLTPEQLRERMVEKLGVEPQPADEKVRAILQFAEVEPARFKLQDGRAELVLSFRELSVARRRHRDFKVHAFYRPVVDGVNATLVQDGTPHIEGRLRTASRMHLHGVLGKVLAKSERLPLVAVGPDTPEQVAAALVGLSTNQFVIEDGWLGLAIGPTRPADRVALQVGRYVR